MEAWLQTPPGQYLLDWERQQVDAAVADVFGYHALQLGVPELQGLANNRMPHRWLALQQVAAGRADPGGRADLCTHFAALPFPAQSLDLVLLPHTLELSEDPHASLREVERTLVPEGRVVICGFNPWSLWGLRQLRGHALRRLGWGSLYLPAEGEFIGIRRLRDWLNLLGFEVEVVRFGCYRPSVSQARWLQRWAWLDRLGARWWPVLGSAYFLVAVKRVRGMRVLGASWKAGPIKAGSPVSVASRLENVNESLNHETR
ncbi:MAG: SAM-dependent methyltransferase [Burkholderiales bacterium PBB4]|nr:MAG: SAM-dependent methyltransferase [Burkholderiales bacterium PBB4]